MLPNRPRPRPALWRGLVVLVALLVTFISRPVHATEYEVFVDVDTEEELYDLYVADLISEGTFLTLVEIQRKGVDLNEASRAELYALPNLSYQDVDGILAYREDVGWIADPADLVRANVISERKLASISMFLVKRVPGRALAATNGFVRYQTAWTQKDTRVTPMALQARVSTLRHLTVGGSAVLTRNRIGTPAWDPNRNALSAERQSTQVHAPKYFATWDTERWGVIAGTYRIGFAQRLIFDNSGRYTPNGFYLDDALFWRTDLALECRETAGELADSPCAGPDGSTYVTPDWDWRDSNRGFAIGAKHLSLPRGWMQLYGFFSHERKDIYQYHVWDKDACDDPNDPDCSAPSVFVRRDDLLAPTSAYRFQTLPSMYDEIVGGANVTYFYDRRTHVGLTGYGAGIDWRLEGANLDFQETARTPYGGPYGAFGADAAWGRDWADIFLEVGGTVTSQPSVIETDDRDAEVGIGAILRHVASWKVHEIEVVGRFYGQSFNNPYGRPIAAADQFEGQRARDEAGGRIRYTARLLDRIDLRSSLDVWTQPFANGIVELEQNSISNLGGFGTVIEEETLRREGLPPKLVTYVRADADATDWLRPGLWLQYSDRDLRDFRRDGACYGGAGDLDFGEGTSGSVDVADAGGDPSSSGNDLLDAALNSNEAIALCSGEQFRIYGRARFLPIKRLSITGQYQHTWETDPRRGGGFGNPEVDVDPAGNSYIPDQDKMRQDMSTWLIVNAQPLDGWRLRGRFRFLFQDVSKRSSLEESVWLYIDTSYTWRWLVSRIRYDVRGRIDRRDSTAERRPGCLTGDGFCSERAAEHWLRFELEARF